MLYNILPWRVTNYRILKRFIKVLAVAIVETLKEIIGIRNSQSSWRFIEVCGAIALVKKIRLARGYLGRPQTPVDPTACQLQEHSRKSCEPRQMNYNRHCCLFQFCSYSLACTWTWKQSTACTIWCRYTWICFSLILNHRYRRPIFCF